MMRLINLWFHPWQGITRNWLVILLTTSLATACTTVRTPELPAINTAGDTQISVGKFVWWDLLTNDPQGAKAFYAALFDWQFDDTGTGEYFVISSDDKPIGGIALHTSKEQHAAPALWLSSLSVADVDAAVERVQAAGGRVLEGPETVSPRGRLAIVRDPLGAPLVLLRAQPGDPPDAPPRLGNWLWTELLTHDIQQAEDFYRSLISYSVKTVRDAQGELYRILMREGVARAGLVLLPWREIDTHWLPYVAVADVDATTRQAIALGGRSLLSADVFDAGTRIAVLADPQGSVFGIQEIPADRREP